MLICAARHKIALFVAQKKRIIIWKHRREDHEGSRLFHEIKKKLNRSQASVNAFEKRVIWLSSPHTIEPYSLHYHTWTHGTSVPISYRMRFNESQAPFTFTLAAITHINCRNISLCRRRKSTTQHIYPSTQSRVLLWDMWLSRVRRVRRNGIRWSQTPSTRFVRHICV